MKDKKKPIRCIGIVGLGLIGGSLGLDLQSLGWNVHGLVHKPTTVAKAKARGLAQVISTDPQILSQCDLVILALPLHALLHPTTELIKALPKTAVITDVGSVKAPVLNTWNKIHPRFVASHPMAGTNESGVEAGKLGLFNQRTWVTTPEKGTDPEALLIIHQIASSLGCKIITTDAEMHDQAVAIISHLPVFISAALLETLGNHKDKSIQDLAIKLASSGFSDTSRVGGGNPQLGTAMAKNNKTAILAALSSYRESLRKIEANILANQWSDLHKQFEFTQTTRSDYINYYFLYNLI